jgi:Fe-S-cluster-containing dehydrogenase component
MHPGGYIDKCTFCHHRVEEGLDPACVSSCPTRCMHFGSLDDPGSVVSRLLKTRDHKVLSPGTGNDPNVYYLV